MSHDHDSKPLSWRIRMGALCEMSELADEAEALEAELLAAQALAAVQEANLAELRINLDRCRSRLGRTTDATLATVVAEQARDVWQHAITLVSAHLPEDVPHRHQLLERLHAAKGRR